LIKLQNQLTLKKLHNQVLFLKKLHNQKVRA